MKQIRSPTCTSGRISCQSWIQTQHGKSLFSISFEVFPYHKGHQSVIVSKYLQVVYLQILSLQVLSLIWQRFSGVKHQADISSLRVAELKIRNGWSRAQFWRAKSLPVIPVLNSARLRSLRPTSYRPHMMNGHRVGKAMAHGLMACKNLKPRQDKGAVSQAHESSWDSWPRLCFSSSCQLSTCQLSHRHSIYSNKCFIRNQPKPTW
jgi:hypothetical protein